MVRLGIVTLVVLLSLCASCGDALPGQDYAGEALYTWTGRMYVQRGPGVNRGRLALFWWDIRQDGFVPLVTKDINITVTDDFPAVYTARLFEPPPAEAFYTTEQGTRMATGLIVLYADLNQDQRYDPLDDRVIGGNSSFAIAYADGTITGDDFELLIGQLDNGYQAAAVLDDDCPPGRNNRDMSQNDRFVFTALERTRPRGRSIDLIVSADTNGFPGDVYACPLNSR